MKTVGKQLQEARLAKNWTPELAARETKIKVDRLHDLEGDDYSHFTSPTYARGFVRTYARALGLDEYRILRQLDNKLPDDDSANIVTDTGVAYLPETAMPPRAAHRDYTGLYIVMTLGAVVTLAIVFVLFEAYRVGELSRYFGNSPETAAANATNAAPSISTTNTIARALPIDSNTPPPIVDTTSATNAAATTNAITEAATTNATTEAAPAIPTPVSPRALPVDSSVVATSEDTNAAPVQAPRALPVDPSELTNAAPDSSTGDATKVAPRALPVDPSELTNAAPATPDATTTVALNTPQPVPTPPVSTPPPANGTDASNGTNGVSTPPIAPSPAPTPPAPKSTSTARQSNGGPVMEPSFPAVAPSTDAAPAAPTIPEATTNASPQTAAPADTDKRLVLTASQDSFVRVTNLDTPDADKPLYAAVLHSGQSVGFDGHKFSINVGIPSAVDIKLDGINYGPHSDQEEPETFVVQSHQP